MSWQTVNAGELMVKRGGSVDPSKYPDEIFDLLSIPAFDKGQIEILSGSEIGSSKINVEPNDVLLAKIIPHIRRCWVVPEKGNRRQIGSGEWIVFRDKRFYPDFLKHFLTSEIFHKQFMGTVAGVGGSLVRARPAAVEKIEIPLPPLEEQKRIAAILDKADAIRRKRQQAIKLADDFLRSVFLEMFGDPVTNPKGWDLLTLDEVCSKITDGEHGTVARVESGRPYLMARNIDKQGNLDLTEISYISDVDHKKIYKRCGAERGDILLVCVGATIGKALIVPEMEEFSLARSVALLKPKDKTSSQYLLYLIKSAGIQQKFVSSGNSSAQAGLYLGKIKALKIPFPPLGLQAEFSVVEARIKSILSKYECGQSAPLSETLSQKAFSGQL